MRLSLATAALVACLLPCAAPASAAQKNDNSKSVKTFKQIKLSPSAAKIGYGRVTDTMPPWTPEEYRLLKQRFATVNPPTMGGTGNPRPPFTSQTQDASREVTLDADGRTTPILGLPVPDLKSKPGTTIRSTSNKTKAASGSGIDILRSVPAAHGTDSGGSPFTSTVGEPSVAGVASSFLLTGNWHAQLSDDDGISWSFLDPENVFPSSDGVSRSDGGNCCDQVVVSERSSSADAMIFWLNQSSNVSASDGNRLRILSFQGRDELLNQSAYCTTDLNPTNLGYDSSTMFDFNQMARSKKWIYVTTNVYDLSPDDSSDTDSDPQKTFREARIMRINYSDLESGDCSPEIDSVVPPLGFAVSPTQGADENSTMYLATQVTSDRDGDGIRVFKSTDSGTLTWDDEDISDFPSSSRGTMTCTLPDGTNACARGDSRISTGWRVGDRSGWLWTVGAGGGYNHPHIQGFVYNSDKEKKSFEPVIYNQDFSWIYPAVTVNSSDQVGLTAYKAGGGDFTRARAFLIKDPQDSSDWSGLQSEGIVSSDNGVVRNAWGDYATLSPYPGCSKTLASAVWRMKGGNDDGDSEHRFAWFGKEGCANLQIEAASFLPQTVKAGKETAIGVTERNTGSASTGTSNKGYAYLSRDDEYSSSDIKLSGEFSFSSISGGGSEGQLQIFTVPRRVEPDTYHVIVCADATNKVDETTGADNCFTAPDLITVTEADRLVDMALSNITMTRPPVGTSPSVSIRLISENMLKMFKLEPVIDMYINIKPVFSERARLLASTIPTSMPYPWPRNLRQQPQQQPLPTKQNGLMAIDTKPLELPMPRGKVAPGHYYVLACLRPSAQKQARKDDCVQVGQINQPGFRTWEGDSKQGQPSGTDQQSGSKKG